MRFNTKEVEFFQHILDQQHEFVGRWTPDTTLIYVNRAYCVFWNSDRDRLIGRKWLDLVREQNTQAYHQRIGFIQKLVNGKQEIRYTTFDINDRYIEWIHTPILNEDGNVSEIQSVGRDMTEINILKSNLEDEKSLLRTIIDSFPAHIYVKNQEGKFTLVNEPYLHFLDFSDFSQIIGKTDFDIYPKDVAKSFFLEDLSIINGDKKSVVRKGVTITDRYRSKSWSYVQVTKFPLKGHDGQILGVVGFNLDLTKYFEAEEISRKSEERIKQIEKLDALGKLAGGIAHDFNNHLEVILGITELLSGKCSGDADLQEYCGSIKKAGDNSRELIKTLQTFAKKQRGELKPVDLSKVVEETILMTENILGSKITQTFKSDVEDSEVIGDSAQIQNVLINLAVNAKDAIGDAKGDVRFVLSPVKIDESNKINYDPALTDGDYLLLKVTDTGSGIAEEHIDNVFEPFFTTKANGTGLGLASAYGTMKILKGSISVKSPPGQGTSFFLLFPTPGSGH